MTNHIKHSIQTLFNKQERWKLYLLNNWKSIIGDLHQHVHIEKIDKTMITLGVSSSAWMQELYMLSPMLLQKINAHLDQPHVKTIRFKNVPYNRLNKRLKNNQSKNIDSTHKKNISQTLQPHDAKAIETV